MSRVTPSNVVALSHPQYVELMNRRNFPEHLHHTERTVQGQSLNYTREVRNLSEVTADRLEVAKEQIKHLRSQDRRLREEARDFHRRASPDGMLALEMENLIARIEALQNECAACRDKLARYEKRESGHAKLREDNKLSEASWPAFQHS